MSSFQHYVDSSNLLQQMVDWDGINGCYFLKDFEEKNGVVFAEMGIYEYSLDVEKFFPGIDIDSEMAKELERIESKRIRDDCCGESEWGGIKDLFELKVKWMEPEVQREEVAAGVIQKAWRNKKDRKEIAAAMCRAMWPRQHPGGNLLRVGDNHPVAIAKLKLDNLREEHKERERQKAEDLEARFRALHEWAESG